MAKQTKVVMVASQGTLDWAYPPVILGSTAAALDMDVTIFFTFYGLKILLKKPGFQISPGANPAMPMKMPFGPKWFQGLNWPIPNMVANNVPFFNRFATSMMKKTFKKKGVATVETLRDMALESGVRLIACQMTMDVFGFKKEDFIDGIDFAGAATMLEEAADSDINLFM
ncbi:MAG: DsrE/DsrF/DrsH-like family protein [Leptospirales bacterium]